MRISRQLLHQWRDRIEREREKQDPAKAQVEQLRQENAELKRAVAQRLPSPGLVHHSDRAANTPRRSTSAPSTVTVWVPAGADRPIPAITPNAKALSRPSSGRRFMLAGTLADPALLEQRRAYSTLSRPRHSRQSALMR